MFTLCSTVQISTTTALNPCTENKCIILQNMQHIFPDRNVLFIGCIYVLSAVDPFLCYQTYAADWWNIFMRDF